MRLDVINNLNTGSSTTSKSKKILFQSFFITTLIILANLPYVVLSKSQKELGAEFLAENAKKPGVIKLPSGLQYKVLKEGTGEFHPTVDSQCSCHYHGTLINGDVFDSSVERGTPIDFAPNQVIKGWTEAMQLMVEGDKFELYIPYDLAYGERGSPPKIPGGATLVFTIEMLKIKGGRVPASKCDPENPEKCSEKEKNYIAKKKTVRPEDLEKELKRLGDMTDARLKPELEDWVNKRKRILGKMLAKSEL